MYFAHLYFGPTANRDYFGALFFGTAFASHGGGVGVGWMPGIDYGRGDRWLIRKRRNEEIITILNAIMRAIDN